MILRKPDFYDSFECIASRCTDTCCVGWEIDIDEASQEAYRKVAGNALGEELDILLSHLRTGGVVQALQLFQTRIGSEEAFRLCSTLIEIDRGIDQTATLEYLADDMARTAKLQIQKQLSTKPGKMRRTYLPAVGVCVALIVYVLVVFTMNQVNTLF